ncbi:MAG: Amuc_1100 family pilus-like protein, partial [Puniceicoccales bacterium]|nr:Amuc_1100 family pilus-like protein [Puniceicoccales bacterium]
MDLKKYPALTAVVGLLSLACLGGIGLTVWQGLKYSSNKSSLTNADGKLQRLLRSDVAPTEENVKAAEANLASMQAYEQRLFAELQGEGGKNFNVDFKDGTGDLKAILQESSTKLTKAIETAGVRIYKPR